MRRQRLAMSIGFNPRSREGSDWVFRRIIDKSVSFNPRSREGSDLMIFSAGYGGGVSIHAPVKGATC